MTTHFIGTTFQPNSQWHQDEKNLIQSIRQQINQHFPDQSNLFINSTWFGPQFDNGEYQKFQALVEQNKKFDNVFLLAAADPVFLNHQQIQKIVNDVEASNLFLLGHFDSPYNFNFHSFVIPNYFEQYNNNELMLKTPTNIFLNYNRKPRDHRIELVNKLFENNLQNLGIITLGKNNNVYNRSNLSSMPLNLRETPNKGNWGMSMEFGIPHDIHSLGNMDIWQSCFLNIVGETEFFPWDHTFVSEKTWKPVIGLRPFVVNGQSKIYAWLRDHGFKTFNHHWPHIEIEDVPEYEVHNSIVSLIKYISSLSESDIKNLYQYMLPDLVYNKNRFFEFGREQKHKTEHLFQ